MGMAASQARYLELTARKTNVEYEGQQINQQRTQLANESAGLFSQLMGLQVPTAPSSNDYTQTQYTFNDGANNNIITDVKNLTGDPNYNKTVTYYHTESVYTGIGSARNDMGVKLDGSTYWLTNGATGAEATKLTQCSTSDTNYKVDQAAIAQIITDTGNTTRFAQNYASSGISAIYKYTSTDGKTYYYSASDLNAAISSGSGLATSLTGYYSANLDKKVYNTSSAYVATASSGRYSDITLAGYSTSFDVNATTTTDANAYNDAINEYEYKQSVYEKQVTDINAKTCSIQAQDKTLELQLRQLDTEQQALSTELDSVKKVIDKNIESTFKTFAS